MVTNDCIYQPYKAGKRCAYGSTMLILWGSLRYNESALTKTVTSPKVATGPKVVDKDLIWW